MKIQLQGVRKKFTDEWLFTIEEHTFESGQIHGLIGHNGVGKTTLLRMIGAFDHQFEGKIRYGRQFYSKELIKKVTYISQDPYMLDKSVYDNLAYPLKIRHFSKVERDKRVMHMLERFGIESLKDRKATVLSAGERERVSMARSFVFEPRLILMDEPTANIAPDAINELEQIMLDYQKEHQATFIIVTHNLMQAYRLCDTLTMMKEKGLSTIPKESIFKNVDQLKCIEDQLGVNYKILGV